MKALVIGGVAAALLTAGLVADGTSPGSANASACNGSAGARVDLVTPSFSNPTAITNPLLPGGPTGQTILLGAESGEQLRIEVTNLPDTPVFRWNGQDIATRVSHFVAYLDGRILETALDHNAQDDAGNVWYFGEDVANYEDGVVVDKDGTWFAGEDGPPGMIMPADPKPGDVFRPENIPGLVFEEVTVKKVDRTVQGPAGKVHGAIFVQECFLDGPPENKQYAPGYGEFRAEVKADDELYQVAVAVPVDALPGPLPEELDELVSAAAVVFDQARSGEWARIAVTVTAMHRAWDRFQTESVPELLGQQMDDALDELEAAVGGHRAARTRQAAINVAHAGLDLQLRHRPHADVDRDRLSLWEDQLLVDRAAHDAGAVAGDRATIRAIRDRIR